MMEFWAANDVLAGIAIFSLTLIFVIAMSILREFLK